MMTETIESMTLSEYTANKILRLVSEKKGRKEASRLGD